MTTGDSCLSLSSADTSVASDVLQASFDSELSQLQDAFLKICIELLTNTSADGGGRVTRKLLDSIERICVFIGRARANNDLLPHLITVLNSRDWQLRAAFFEHIVGVGVFVGAVAFQNFLLPCIEQALFDTQEFVTLRAVTALAALVQIGLFDRRLALDAVAKVGPLLVHPSVCISAQTVNFVVATASKIGQSATLSMLIPLLKVSAGAAG